MRRDQSLAFLIYVCTFVHFSDAIQKQINKQVTKKKRKKLGINISCLVKKSHMNPPYLHEC